MAASWWGYAEGNPALVAIVVAAIALAAIGFVARSWWKRRAGK